MYHHSKWYNITTCTVTTFCTVPNRCILQWRSEWSDYGRSRRRNGTLQLFMVKWFSGNLYQRTFCCDLHVHSYGCERLYSCTIGYHYGTYTGFIEFIIYQRYLWQLEWYRYGISIRRNFGIQLCMDPYWREWHHRLQPNCGRLFCNGYG